MELPPGDFESPVSTSSTTPAISDQQRKQELPVCSRKTDFCKRLESRTVRYGYSSKSGTAQTLISELATNIALPTEQIRF